MFDIDAIAPVGQPRPEPEQLFKAHPAASLINPGWRCPKCQHVNPITAPFCEKCPE